MADLEFFLDPVCPYAWVTSRWVVEVQELRNYDVTWRFIALSILNENQQGAWYTPQYRAGHMAGTYSLRVADELRLTAGNDAVGALYTTLGTALHNNRQRQEFSADIEPFMATVLAEAGQDPSLAAHVHDDSHDAYIRAETELALQRTGKDLGTPIITFHPGAANEASFFGPVISTIARGAEALRLWDAVEIVATTSGMAELKRSNRAPLSFD